MKAFLIIVLVMLLLSTYGQQSHLVKGRVFADGRPLPLTTLSFGNIGTALTDNEGYFSRTFSSTVTLVRIDKIANYEFISPPNGVIPVAKEQSFVFDIVLSTNAEKQATANQLANQLEHIVKLSNSVEEVQISIQKFIDETKQLYQKQFEAVEIEILLKQERERILREEGKARHLPIITGSIDHYISRTRDLRDEFRRRGDRVFNDTGQNINEINRRVLGYSEAYEQLNASREKFNIEVGFYWQDPNLQSEINSLLARILDDFHKSTVLKYNLLFKEIDDYNQNVKGHRKRPEIKHDIDEYVEVLSQNIDIMDRNKAIVIQKLKDY